MIRPYLCAAMLLAAYVVSPQAQAGSAEQAKVTLVYDHVLPNVPG